MYVWVFASVLLPLSWSCEFDNPEHTVCKYATSECSWVRAGMTDAQRQAAVDVHNTLRQRVASGGEVEIPAAADMRLMSYDADLEKTAQLWANQCKLDHDSVRYTAQFPYVGQNVAVTFTKSTECLPNITEAVLLWYQEVKTFNSDSIDPFIYESKYGHFSQVAWSGSYKLGCGYTCFNYDGVWNAQLYVCNYGPAGNWLLGTMYKPGSPVSQCPDGSSQSQTYRALCG